MVKRALMLTLLQELKNPQVYRAVANANGANQIAILIPCHRVINTNGALVWLWGRSERKAQLLTLEQRGG